MSYSLETADHPENLRRVAIDPLSRVEGHGIVATTHNNQAMNEAVRQVAQRYLSGREITEGLLNHIEVAIRAFDPCLSCATHALGKMPLQVELLDAAGDTLSTLTRSADGIFS